jgi:hypothetical protein
VGLVGWPLASVLICALIVLIWVVYLFLRFGDKAFDLGVELLKSLSLALVAELQFKFREPALKLESFLLLFLLASMRDLTHGYGVFYSSLDRPVFLRSS